MNLQTIIFPYGTLRQIQLISFILVAVLVAVLLTVSTNSQAVNVSQNDTGQVIILPYYSVNNNLLTLSSVVNNTDSYKAIKINFREGQNGLSVYSFNLYLAPHDIWAFGLRSVSSDAAGHEGENTARIAFSDNSCAPFLQSRQQFLPDLIALDSGSKDMQRSTEGFIEIFEMGEINPSSDFAESIEIIDGVPRNCQQITENWQDAGAWQLNPDDKLLPPAGGLQATASILNVGEGTAFTFKGLVLDNFYPEDTIWHTAPDNHQSPSMNDAMLASLLINDGEIIQSQWENGFEAVSALIMNNEVINDFAMNVSINAKTEWVLTFPTKHYYVNGDEVLEPFQNLYNPQAGSCEIFTPTVWDRESHQDVFIDLGDPPGPNTIRQFCWSSNVVVFQDLYRSPFNQTTILGSLNTHLFLVNAENGTNGIDFENGYAT
ncbi:MAG: hypothetical protein L3J52_08600, partial [Proteobacteria bacterium]|nr:hypothetical protein [Pseudomonadota bacterium]